MGGDYGNDPGLPRGVMSERRGSRITGRLLFGALLVTLGVLWTLDNLGLADADQFLRWWPAALIVYGVLRVTGLDGTRRPVSGILFVFAGGWMLAHSLGIVSVSFFRLWPVFLIAIGGSLVFRSVRGPGGTGDTAEAHAYPRPFAFMGGNVRTIESQSLVGLEATAVMGGVEADLRGARARGSEVAVEVFAWWGGIELIVPEDWRVVSEVMPIMGGVEDKTRLAEGGGATTLVVRGMVVMGGLEIKNTKSESPFRGVKVGVVTTSRSGRRKEVRVDASGVTITRDDGPPPPPPPPPPTA
jgi:hypothetical protein